MSDHEIRRLDEQTIERIAAGEVVERPASVVKELVENSIDAGADRIEVDVKNGGIKHIRVADNGQGIPGTDLPRAVQKHTTSKLRDADHLAQGIETLGFRGEALHTIGAVSRMTISSRRRNGSSDGARLTVEGGSVGSTEATGCPPGTIVEVSELFYNTPARHAFLGSTETEFDHVNRVVTEYALANPDIAFSLRHEQRDVFSTPGRGDLQEVILAVWGREVAESMVPLDINPDQEAIMAIHGMLSHPETTRSRSRYLAMFVNGRAVRSAAIRDGILDGYGTQVAPDRYPFAAIFCEIDPRAVDVNVHPRKTEIRFDNPTIIEKAVSTAVHTCLLDHGLIRSTAARGQGAPAETTVPEFVRDESPEPIDNSSRGNRGFELPQSASNPQSIPSFREQPVQQTIAGNEPQPNLDQFPSLRVLGQVAETYIVAETADGLILIDQHAADERIHYERLRDRFSSEAVRQELVEPVDIEVTGDEAAGFSQVTSALEQLGFKAEAITDLTLRVTEVPTIVDTTVSPERIRDAIGSAISATDTDSPLATMADHLIADMACHPAITGNEPLSEGSVIQLLEALDECENPYACPHGRPTIVRIDAKELSERFERDYPGHTTRRPES